MNYWIIMPVIKDQKSKRMAISQIGSVLHPHPPTQTETHVLQSVRDLSVTAALPECKSTSIALHNKSFQSRSGPQWNVQAHGVRCSRA